MTFKNIQIEIKGSLATVWLNQPETRNALQASMINDLIEGLKQLEADNNIRVVLLRGKGTSFCAGADINWMKDSGSSGYRKNYRASKVLSACFQTIYNSNKVVINLLHGHAFGGGMGFLGTSDFNFAVKDTLFCLPEFKLGLAPSVITPYLLTRIDQKALKFQTFQARIFNSEEALESGLVDEIFEDINEMEQKTEEIIQSVSKVSANALGEYKKLLRELNKHAINKRTINKTIQSITSLKMSPDAKTRMTEFITRKNKK